MKKRPETATPCATCPFLRGNFGRPNPEGYDPKRAEAENPGQRFYNWYSEENLRRLWLGIRGGEALICHATDAGAYCYGGKPAAPGCERPCTGALAVILLHLKFVESFVHANPAATPAATMRAYRAAAGRFPMSREGLFAWTLQINSGRAGGNLLGVGGLVIPASVSSETVAACGVPWLDSIVNGEGAREP
jgi:hypothetical protein